MSADKNAHSQASWALITEGVSSARINAYRLSHLVQRALELVGKSHQKEHLYQVAGDIIQALPERLEKLEADLDRASYVLSRMGEESLRDRLPLAERTLVDESLHKAKTASAARVGARFLDKQGG